MQFLRKVFEDEDDDEKARSERSDQELALAKAVDAMEMGLESGIVGSAAAALRLEIHSDPDDPALARTKDYRKMAVLYMLLSACVADVNMAEEGMGSPRITKGYDARHRVALRLLATWLDVSWNKMVRPIYRTYHALTHGIQHRYELRSTVACVPSRSSTVS